MKVPIPAKYKEQFTNRKSKSHTDEWSNTVICFILRNQTYVGDKVNGKQKTRLIEKIDHSRMPQEDWIVHRDKHEAIIPREDFDKVNELLNKKRDAYRQSCEDAAPLTAAFQNTFAKKIICKECGCVMQYFRKNKGSTQSGFQEAYYTCSPYKDAPCRNTVYEDFIKAVALDQIKNLFKYVFSLTDSAKALKDGQNEKSALYSGEKKLVHLKKKEADYEILMANLYKDLTDEVIDEDEFKMLTAKYAEEKKAVQAQIEKLNETVYKVKKWISRFEDLGAQFTGYMNGEIDSRQIIDELIDRIYYAKDGSVEIVFTCEDVIENFCKVCEGGNGEEDSDLFATVAG